VTNPQSHPPLPQGAQIGQMISFQGNKYSGQWRIIRNDPIVGDGLPDASFLQIGSNGSTVQPIWSLRASISNLRYTTAAERSSLQSRQEGLGRQGSALSVLILIRKSTAWWALAQDERLAIYARSKHTQIGLDYLPAIARQLHHCRDLGEPFDFLTWFEFAESQSDHFRHLLQRLRDTEEWCYVDREVKIWMSKNV
jgi:hypothetical protein